MLTKDKVLKGRYRIIDSLGQDETSAVYEAYDSIRKATVALKEILIDSEKVPSINERESLKRAFADRAKILAEVKHESLPQVRGYFSEYDRQYLILELIDGDDTAALLAKNEKPILFSDAANWADQLLDALDYLHTLSTPIIHGDVKPQNVKLTSRGRIKLLGFDITESVDAKINSIVTNQTSVGATLPYLPLEQLLQTVDMTSAEDKKNHGAKLEKAMKQPTDARSDVYSLGATLYHLITAQLPVDALERTLEVWAGGFDSLPASNELNPAIPVEVSDVLAKAMEIEPEKRFGSAMEMRQALQTAVTRAKERTAEEAKKQEQAAVREVLQVEEKRLEQERQRVEQERSKLEAEQKQQKELIEKQLKAAEAERVKAEQRAAEAEKRLLEEETKKAAEKKGAAKAATAAGSSANNFSSQKNSISDDSSSMFSEPEPSAKPSWLMPAIVVFFLLVGGAGAGIWMMRSPDKVEANQTIPTPATPVTDIAIPQPTVEAALQPSVEKISTTTAPTTDVEKPGAQSAPKNRPTPQPAAQRAEKTPAPKPTTKKAVTVDDIIGGN